MTEKQLTKAIIEHIKLAGGWAFQTHRPGQFATEKGVSDIAACYKGQFIAIEVKGPRAKEPTPEQLNFQWYIKQAGGIAFIARSLESVIERLELPQLL